MNLKLKLRLSLFNIKVVRERVGVGDNEVKRNGVNQIALLGG